MKPRTEECRRDTAGVRLAAEKSARDALEDADRGNSAEAVEDDRLEDVQHGDGDHAGENGAWQSHDAPLSGRNQPRNVRDDAVLVRRNRPQIEHDAAVFDAAHDRRRRAAQPGLDVIGGLAVP